MKKMIQLIASLGASVTLSFHAHAACLTPHELEKPDHIYTVGTNTQEGTVLDKETNLMWSQCPVGFSFVAGVCESGPDTADDKSIWGESFALAASSNLGGFSDWRIPNIKELQTLMARACNNQALNAAAFPELANDSIWSATPNVRVDSRAWVVNKADAISSTQTKGSTNYVYLVRDQ